MRGMSRMRLDLFFAEGEKGEGHFLSWESFRGGMGIFENINIFKEL